jgi:hypothetical protein
MTAMEPELPTPPLAIRSRRSGPMPRGERYLAGAQHGLDQRFGFWLHGGQGLLLRRLDSIFALVSFVLSSGVSLRNSPQPDHPMLSFTPFHFQRSVVITCKTTRGKYRPYPFHS